MLAVEAPAKINLTMEVLGKRSDGYHEIRSVVQTISLRDTLCFSSSEKIEFKCSFPGWSAQQSLVSKAIDLIKSTSKYEGGVVIDLEKHIPLMAGLGGDSSDAAAVLFGLNKMWQLDVPLEKMTVLASQLGSDVPFFLYGGTALLEGRGDEITRLADLPSYDVVLVNPSVPHLPGKTAAAYSGLRPSHFTDGLITNTLVNDTKNNKEIVPERLYNVFENVFFTWNSQLTTYRDHIKKIGAPFVHLAGSGPSMYTLIKDKDEAADLATRLNGQGMEVYQVETCNQGVTLVTG